MDRKTGWLVAALLALVAMTGCASGSSGESPGKKGDEANATAGGTEDANARTPVSVKLVEAWYAKGEDGGYFAALQQGFYKEKGIDMTIQPGGPQVSSLQMVASGKADFGISYADDLLRAREQGIPVVGLLAAFQYTPQVLIYHAGADIQKFEDLNGKTIYLTPGVLYWDFIKSKYKLDKVNELNYTGQLVNFINNQQSLNQGYVTNEPFALKQQGIDVSYLKIADSGYANYADVLFTTEDYLAKHPDVADAVVKASQRGWSYYLDNYRTVNPFIKTYNPDMSVEAMDYEAVHEKEFIVTDLTKAHGIGDMTGERWSTLQDQLMDIQALKEKQDVTRAFTTRFLQRE